MLSLGTLPSPPWLLAALAVLPSSVLLRVTPRRAGCVSQRSDCARLGAAPRNAGAHAVW